MVVVRKEYTAKIYTFGGVFKLTINPRLILNEISFSSNINWWQGQLALSLGVPYEYNLISKGDMVKVWVTDENNANTLIYTGNITRVKRQYQWNFEGVTIQAIWLYAFMNRIFFVSWWNRVFSLNQEPAQTIKDAVDYFNSIYTAGRFSHTWVDNFWSSMDLDFNFVKCNFAIANVQKETDNYYFFVGADWNFQYKERDKTIISHTFTLEDDVLSLVSDEDIESLANYVFVEYVWGWIASKQDATSQWLYGLVETKGSSNTKTAWSAWISAQNILDQNKDFKKETPLVINTNYNIESIKPWDFIKLKNSKYNIDGIQVLKTQYKYDRLSIFLDKYSTLSDEISLL